MNHQTIHELFEQGIIVVIGPNGTEIHNVESDQTAKEVVLGMPIFPMTITENNGDDHEFNVQAKDINEAFDIADDWAEENLS